MPILFLFLIILFPSCVHKDSDQKKIKMRNLKGEYIYRQDKEILFAPPLPIRITRENYPWEEKYIGKFPKITKEFFRCKGNVANPPVVIPQEGREPLRYFDCGGGQRHGLPLDNGKEFIYPCLLEILNYIQDKSGKAVVITSGHRCPEHNLYCDSSKSNWGSKHMVGAEVDFFVRGLEDKPLEVIKLIQDFYNETEPYKNIKEYQQFARYEKSDTNTSIQPWYNKEIYVKLYQKNEGRNFDNRHQYPYISIQVRYDKERDSKVLFDSKKAQSFLRY